MEVVQSWQRGSLMRSLRAILCSDACCLFRQQASTGPAVMQGIVNLYTHLTVRSSVANAQGNHVPGKDGGVF